MKPSNQVRHLVGVTGIEPRGRHQREGRLLELEDAFPREIPDIGWHENVLLNLHQIRPLVAHLTRLECAVFERHHRRPILVTDHFARLRHALDDSAHGQPVAHQGLGRAHCLAFAAVEMIGHTAGLPEKCFAALDITLCLEQGLQLRSEPVCNPVSDKQTLGDRRRQRGLRRRAEHFLKLDFLRICQ